jgi:alcohol dehydrogenase YqhD (iron-dependent ADH family)
MALIHSSKIAVGNPTDYEARSNIMWIATWALNTLVSKGKSTDRMVRMIGQSIGAYTDATHGMTLSAISTAYYRCIMPYGLAKFKRYAVNVWDVDSEGKPMSRLPQEDYCRNPERKHVRGNCYSSCPWKAGRPLA